MIFEYDPEKSKVNLKKHGIDFEQAQKIWKGSYVEFSAKSEFENRFAMIGFFGDKLYTCIYTLRGNKIRLISCRRSREKEIALYEKSIKEAKNG